MSPEVVRCMGIYSAAYIYIYIYIYIFFFFPQCYSTRVTVSSLDSRPWLLSQGIHSTRHAVYIFTSSVQVLQAGWSITKSGEFVCCKPLSIILLNRSNVDCLPRFPPRFAGRSFSHCFHASSRGMLQFPSAYHPRLQVLKMPLICRWGCHQQYSSWSTPKIVFDGEKEKYSINNSFSSLFIHYKDIIWFEWEKVVGIMYEAIQQGIWRLLQVYNNTYICQSTSRGS